MSNKRLLRYLIYYYGVLQSVHLVLVLVAVFGDTDAVLNSLSSGLVGDAAKAMMISTYMDLLVSVPTGLIFVWGYINKRVWSRVFGWVSLNFSMASSFVYMYVLLVFKAWEWSLGNILILVAFAPMVWLYFIYHLRGR